MSEIAGQVTELLHLWSAGHQEALDRLMPLVYDQLHTLANRHMKHENPGHTLRATELVHEAYLKLVGSDVSVQDRAHFYALASRVIWQILTNHGKAKRRYKRGGGAPRMPLEEALVAGEEGRDQVLEINEALDADAATLGSEQPRRPALSCPWRCRRQALGLKIRRKPFRRAGRQKRRNRLGPRPVPETTRQRTASSTTGTLEERP